MAAPETLMASWSVSRSTSGAVALSPSAAAKKVGRRRARSSSGLRVAAYVTQEREGGSGVVAHTWEVPVSAVSKPNFA